MIVIDPITRQRVVLDKRSGDIVFNLTGDLAISQETIPVVGPWKDFTGSDATVNSKGQQQSAGLSNQLEGTDPGIMGAKVPSLGIVGQNIETTRRRTIKRYMEVGKNGKNKFS